MARPSQNRAAGWTWRLIGAAVTLSLFVLLIWLNDEYQFRGGGPLLLLLPFLVGGFFWMRGNRHLARSGEKALADDARPPIVYLRSFETESAVGVEEEAFAEMFQSAGPFVAIGEPGEKLPPLGAARIYVEDDNWKAVVIELLNRAQLVITFGGITPGLGWELGQIRKLLRPERVVIMMPNSAESWQGFQRLANAKARLNLPDFPDKPLRKYASTGLAGFVRFSDNWTPEFVPLPRRAERGRSLHSYTGPEFGRAWTALAAVSNQAGLDVEGPKENYVVSTIMGLAIIALVLTAISIPVTIFLMMGGF